MKIISNKECYVQRCDLEYLLSDDSISLDNKYNILSVSKMIFDNKYVKVDDPKLIDCILSNDNILDFANYYNLPMEQLTGIKLKLILAIKNIDDYSKDVDTIDSLAYYKEKREKEYLLSQIKQLIAYKKKESKCNMPNIPNPALISLSNDRLAAALSLDFDNVLIYTLDGQPISNDEDKAFCNAAYQLLMHDELINEEGEIKLEASLSEDGKYLSISKAKEKEYKRKYIKRN